MKSFKQYLMESDKTYEFNIKIAGDCPADAPSKIKSALVRFEPISVDKGIRTPIQDYQIDFPNHKNVEITTFTVVLDYPATTEQVKAELSTGLEITPDSIIVRTDEETAEIDLNTQYEELKPGPALLNTPYSKENNQELVGEKRKFSLLKELGKESHHGEVYDKVNTELLAKRAPVEGTKRKKSEGALSNSAKRSPVGSRPTKLPNVTTTGGL